MRTVEARRAHTLTWARADVAARRDADIAFYVRRVARDPIGAADRSRLAGLYLQRARETGDFVDYRRAVGLAGPAPAPRVAHHEDTHVMLAAAFLPQHPFVHGHAAAPAANARL